MGGISVIVMILVALALNPLALIKLIMYIFMNH